MWGMACFPDKSSSSLPPSLHTITICGKKCDGDGRYQGRAEGVLVSISHVELARAIRHFVCLRVIGRTVGTWKKSILKGYHTTLSLKVKGYI